MWEQRQQRLQTSTRIGLTWEIPVLVVLVVVMVLLMTPLLGQGIASLLWTGQWAWPNDIRAALGGLLNGETGAGFAPDREAPPSAAVWGFTVASYVIAFAAMAGCAAVSWHTLGPGAPRGLAAGRQAGAVLGVAALRGRGSTIRPDLSHRQRKVER